MLIEAPTVLMPGLSARPTSTGFVAVDLGYEADPVAFTPDVIAAEKKALPGWRWRKEYERDFGAQAGMPVFNPEWTDRQRKRAINPAYCMAWEPDSDKGPLVRKDDGPIRVYLAPDTQPTGLPEDTKHVLRSCGLGIDVGEGVGQSDSTIQVFFVDNREQCAEFASNRIRPTDLGRLAVAMATYFNKGLICCVRKMHGITVLRSIMDDCGYMRVWRSKVVDQTTEYEAKNYGWPGGESTSPYLFGKWMDAIQHDRTILHSMTTIQQHQQYIYDESGRITHQQRANLPVEVRERHGDLVVACALAYRACLDMPKYEAETRRKIPVKSMAWRAQQAKIQRRSRDRWGD